MANKMYNTVPHENHTNNLYIIVVVGEWGLVEHE